MKQQYLQYLQDLQELEEAVKDMKKLHSKISEAGIPPHTDYWHQSIYEHELRIKNAYERLNIKSA